jgi:hypothetical protein
LLARPVARYSSQFTDLRVALPPSPRQSWYSQPIANRGISETKEDRSELSKWGNDLRQTFRTIATAAGVSEIDAKLLMNHSIPGVNAGYITRHKLLEDHLRRQQQAISSAAIAALGATLAENGALQGWLGRGAGHVRQCGVIFGCS